MMLSRRRFMTIAAGTAVAGSAAPVAAKTVSWRGIALGAEAKLIINGLPEIEARRLIELARTEIERLAKIAALEPRPFHPRARAKARLPQVKAKTPT